MFTNTSEIPTLSQYLVPMKKLTNRGQTECKYNTTRKLIQMNMKQTTLYASYIYAIIYVKFIKKFK